VIQSGNSDRGGPISKHGPKYLRWALFEVALHACTHPLYRDRYQRTKKRLGRVEDPCGRLTGMDAQLSCAVGAVEPRP
jgi:transposase